MGDWGWGNNSKIIYNPKSRHSEVRPIYEASGVRDGVGLGMSLKGKSYGELLKKGNGGEDKSSVSER